MVSQKDQTKTS